jgi:hypothetical protein
MIEVAVLEAQEKIKVIDAAFTWPHHSDKGYFVSAIFVRTNRDEKYLIYCPKSTAAISVDEWEYNPYLIWCDEKPMSTREVRLNQTLSKTGDILFYVIALGHSETKVKKEDIEKLFGIKVVD